MVNNITCRLVVTGSCLTTDTRNGRVSITNGPIYDLSQAKTLLRNHGLRVINETAQADQANRFQPEMDDEELAAFILALQPDDRNGSERCKTSVGMQIDCDSYALRWNRNLKVRWEHGTKIYVKFGFSENNPRCLVVSIHPADH